MDSGISINMEVMTGYGTKKKKELRDDGRWEEKKKMDK